MQFGRDDGVDVSAYDTLRFWLHGGSSGGQTIQVQISDRCVAATLTVHAQANGWQQVDVPLAELARPYRVYSLVWWNPTPDATAPYYVDDVTFVASGAPGPALVVKAGPALQVDAASARHPISPEIYGMNFTDENLAAELRLPVRRWGGNSTTRYNWQNDTSNTGSDWYFENIPQDNPNPALLPDGSTTDRFIEQDRRTGTDTLLTVPMIGWVANRRTAGHPFDCGFNVSRYGAQESVDYWDPDCGNGVLPGGALLTGNNPLDTSIPITTSFVQDWMRHLIGKYGTAAHGGVRFYALDNEPMLWNSTHRDVHPQPTSYDEMAARSISYAAAIKAIDPSGQVLGPVVWGWVAYFYSALDVAAGGSWWDTRPDRRAHDDIPFVPWYLQQMAAYEQQHGVRLLDYVDVHYYPQTEGVFSNAAGDAATQERRLRSTRSLWDRSYVDESWIGEPVYLLPRMHEWEAENYPGVRLAVTEYSWGAMCHISGALAQADVLGIFGRERLDLATLWAPPESGQPGAFAFRMYRNYDTAGGPFGDVGVAATSADQERLAVYAAQRSSDASLTVLVINKTRDPMTTTLTLAGFAPAGPAAVYRYGSDDTAAIHQAGAATFSQQKAALNLPPQSITMLEVPADKSLDMPVYLPLMLTVDQD